MSEWISVEDRLPEGKCLVFIPGDRLRMHTAHYHPNIVTIGGRFEFDMEPVTHWMPLPEPPKVEQEVKERLMSEWEVEYGNDTGPNDESFIEWFDVSDGITIFRADEEKSALWLKAVLDGNQDPSDKVEQE